ncbi:hypothetical protein RJT34_18537 [Clitoria ternatea]|uniref:Uncharacterized protein n=1 Tax=Clitoria ternatea TaxID=43366 RepID=A0AAN9PEM9_CLITE
MRKRNQRRVAPPFHFESEDSLSLSLSLSVSTRREKQNYLANNHPSKITTTLCNPYFLSLSLSLSSLSLSLSHKP